MQLDESVWGSDAQEFLPERWLDGTVGDEKEQYWLPVSGLPVCEKSLRDTDCCSLGRAMRRALDIT